MKYKLLARETDLFIYFDKVAEEQYDPVSVKAYSKTLLVQKPLKATGNKHQGFSPAVTENTFLKAYSFLSHSPPPGLLRHNGTQIICQLKYRTNRKLIKVLLSRQTTIKLLPNLFYYCLLKQLISQRLRFRKFRKVRFREKYKSKEFKCYHASFFFST